MSNRSERDPSERNDPSDTDPGRQAPTQPRPEQSLRKGDDDQRDSTPSPAGEPARRSAQGDRGEIASGIGTVAKRTIVTLFVLGALVVTVLGLGFLVYRGRIAPGPFLLLVGLVVGFLMGRLDAVL